MEQRVVKLTELFKDEQISKKLVSLSAEEASRYLKEEFNLDFSVDELNDIAAGMKQAMEKDSSDELTEESLEAVAGGLLPAYTVGYYVGRAMRHVLSQITRSLRW